MDRPVIISVMLVPRESKLNSVIKDVAMLVIAITMYYLTSGSPVWEVLSAAVFIAIGITVIIRWTNANTKKYCNLDDAIHELEELSINVANGSYKVKIRESKQ